MNSTQLSEWLLENAGPVIKYRTANELMEDSALAKKYLPDLLAHKSVIEDLEVLDNFGPIRPANPKTYNSIHSGEGPEGILYRLRQLGLHYGIPELDSRVQKFTQYIDNEFVEKAKTQPVGYDAVDVRSLGIATILSSRLLFSGYDFQEAVDFTTRMINLLYTAAEKKVFDIYPDDEELLEYPKVPKVWKQKNTPVVKRKHYPDSRTEPLPTINQIIAIAHLPKKFIDEKLQVKIDTIIEYISDDRFQQIHEGYGIIYYEKSNTYYGWGWRPLMPCMNDFSTEDGLFQLVRHMDIYSNFPIFRQTKWYKKCLSYLSHFETDLGTFSFDRNILKYHKLGENRKIRKANEIESTFIMLLLLKRSGLL